jgi:hypothetical protein
MKKSFKSGINDSKKFWENLEHAKNIFIQKCTNPLKILKNGESYFSDKIKHSIMLAVQKYWWYWEKLCRQWPELWPRNWFLYYDNTPAHWMLSVKHFMGGVGGGVTYCWTQNTPLINQICSQ